MAGLFGFYTRAARPTQWMTERLSLLQRAMIRRAHHRVHVEIHAHAAFGNTGPGLHAGTLTSYSGPNCSVLMAEGEIYRVGPWSSAERPFDEAWPLVQRAWASGDSDALVNIDGLYTLVQYEPASAEGPRLTLANDRYGSRRLFVLEDGDELVFAADFAALAAWLGSRLEIDPEFIQESICLGTPIGGKTWARQIRLFPSATELRVSKSGMTKIRYWDFSRLQTTPDVDRPVIDKTQGAGRGSMRQTVSFPAAIDSVDAAWSSALAHRLRGDRLGQQLSGGLDSRLILADGSRRTEWLTVTYGERGSDEVRFAERCARKAGTEWLFWELPGEHWLERRVRLSIENGGFVDLMNGHHAGLLEHLATRLQFEVSGFAGDVVLGDTYVGLTAQEAFCRLPYWHSPASPEEGLMQRRVLEDIGNQDSWAWMMETKMRRLINYWPHLAVNDVEVRKPFMDYRLVECCAAVPLSLRHERVFHRELIRRRAPGLLTIPLSKTAAAPGISPFRGFAARALRRAHRAVQPGAAALGMSIRPWVRGAYAITEWLKAPDVQQRLRDELLGSNARLAAHVDRDAIAQTLALGFEGGRLADEVPLNLYRIERILRHIPEWTSANRRAEL